MDRAAEGAWAERVVERRLRRDGWQILRRNARISGIEVDIIARRGSRTVLWEVKRVRPGHDFPALGGTQRQRLGRAAMRYAADSPTSEVDLGLATVAGGRLFPKIAFALLGGEE